MKPEVEEIINEISAPATADGLLVYCSDFRFWRLVFRYMMENLKINKFDILCYPGSACNLVREQSFSHIFLDRIRFLLNRHQFHTIVLVNHTDCGAYGDRVTFPSPDVEKQIHITDLMSAKAKLHSEMPGVNVILLYVYQDRETAGVERVF